MQAEELAIPGCYRLKGARFEDDRGDFLKLFHEPAFAALGLESDFRESYVTTSRQGVIRGMHFQAPPSDHAKLVSCLTGCVRDGLVDLRRGSPTYGQGISLLLTGTGADILYIPRGVAHGFAAFEDETRMWYLVSSTHDAAADSGVRWDSVGIDWWEGAEYVEPPIVSARDQDFVLLCDFETPFVFCEAR